MTEHPGEDPGHLLPEEDWERVVREAEREAERIRRGDPPPEAPKLRGFGTGALAVSGVVTAGSHGGPRGRPTFGVWHSMETPLRAGYAASIARYFAGGPGTSCHYTVDPAETWGVLPDGLLAWHVGTANTHSVGLEQAGYASFTRAQWLAAEGMAMLRRSAAVMRALQAVYGIGPYMMTDAQLLAAHHGALGGWATHDQCRRVIGGTTHTDPGSAFPVDVLLQLAAAGTTEGDDDMTPDQAQALNEIRGSMQNVVPAVSRLDAAVPQLRNEVAALRNDVDHLQAGGVDLDALADKLADRLAARLSS